MTALLRRPAAAWIHIRAWLWPVLALVGLGWALTHTSFDRAQMLQVLGHVNLAGYGSALLVFYLASILRACRWRMLLRNAGQRTALTTDWRAIMMGWLINGLIPAKTGDLYRAHAIERAYPITLARTLGTIALERLVDFAVLVLLIDGFALAFFRGNLPTAFLGVFLVMGVLGLAVIIALVAAPHLRWNVASRFPWLAGGPLGRFQEGFVQAPGNLPLLFAITAGLWLFESARLYLVLHALPLQALSLTQVSLVALVGSALTAVPGLPGGVALVEGGIIGVLIYFGLSAAAALSVALLDRAINYWSVLLLGAVILVAGRLFGRAALPRARVDSLVPAPVRMPVRRSRSAA